MKTISQVVNNLKNKLIALLGGVTAEQYIEKCFEAAELELSKEASQSLMQYPELVKSVQRATNFGQAYHGLGTNDESNQN